MKRLISRSIAVAACGVLAGLLSVASASAAEWRVVSVDGSPAVEEPAIHFMKDGAFAGTTGCNRFRGSATLREGRLRVEGPVVSMKRACVHDAVMAQEHAMLALLRGDLRVEFDVFRNELTLAGEDGSLVLVPAVAGGSRKAAR